MGFVKTGCTDSNGEMEYELDIPKLADKQFAMFFLRNLAIIHSTKNINYHVFFELVNLMDYDNIIALNSHYKKKISKATGLTIGAIETAMTRILDSGIVRRVERGVYFVDPRVVGKGQWNDIYKLQIKFTALAKSREGVKRIQIEKEIDYDVDLREDSPDFMDNEVQL